MKTKCLFRLIVVLLFITVLLGCRTRGPVEEPIAVVSVPVPDPVPWVLQAPEPEPDVGMSLTPEIIYRLFGVNMQNLENPREPIFLLSEALEMERKERVDPRLIDRMEQNGSMTFQNVVNVIGITILDRAEALSSSIEILDGEIVVSVGFESDDKYRLKFSAPAGYPLSEELYYLQYTPFEDITPGSIEKGTIEYGGNEYLLRYRGERPYLLIEAVFQDEVIYNRRTIPRRPQR